MRTTTDRCDIIHFAGFPHLSPALDERGAPAFSAEPGDGLARCSWETFFRRLGERELGMVYDPEDPSSARFVWAHQPGAPAPAHGSLGHAVAHSRRFWKALLAGLLLLASPLHATAATDR